MSRTWSGNSARDLFVHAACWCHSIVLGSKGGYGTVNIDVTQTPDQHGITTAIPIRAREVAPRRARYGAEAAQRAAAGKLE
eukprot:3082805-Prymnesium_polylepis.1